MKPLLYLRDSAVFAPCYVVLDWASYIDPVGPFNITPWNPQAALALVWLLLGGMRYAPAVLATVVLAEVVVRGAPGGPAITLAIGVVLTLAYAGIAYALTRSLPDMALRSAKQLSVFCGIVLLGTALLAAAFISLLRATDLLASVPLVEAWLRFWVGDAVGVLVTAPLLLAAADTTRRRELVAMAGNVEVLIQALVMAATLWLIFRGLSGDPARHIYQLFLPLIWIAVRTGMNGAVWATAFVQIGVVLGIHADRGISLSIVELQALVAALTLTGLFLGVIVDERRRAEAGLRQSLRLAAAGEMAGAIAHEVNQPLTALSNYGRSIQLLADGGPAVMPQIQSVVARMLAEAERAAEVVRRLRDFFRAGTTRLEVLALDEVLESARRIGDKIIDGRDVALEVSATPEAGLAVYADRLQLEVVLRNLLANAVEAVKDVQEPRVVVLARHEAQAVRVSVLDNGPGVQAATDVFEPFVSGKPMGMGLGLAVSRAIAEAHGGSLVSVRGERGEFVLVLPCART